MDLRSYDGVPNGRVREGGNARGMGERAEKKVETEKTPFEERVQVMVSDLERFGRIALKRRRRVR